MVWTLLVAMPTLIGQPVTAEGDDGPMEGARDARSGISIPQVDLAGEEDRQTIVDSVPGQYLGHPTTVLMGDGRTLLTTYPLGHGGPAAVLRRSDDGGHTWTDRLPVPENWATATNCPSIHRLTDPAGVERLFVFEGNGAMRQAMSEDAGETWTPFEENGLRCVVAPNTILRIAGGRHLAVYHRGRPGEETPALWQSISEDGGLTWGPERRIMQLEGTWPAEPALVRSPDGGQIACLIRENARVMGSLLIATDDEGETWSAPMELPAALTGDRHMPRYTEDGRLVITFRDMAHGSPTRGDFVIWVGTYEDIVEGREGEFRARLLTSYGRPGDTGYAGLERLPDGSFITVTYAPLKAGEPPAVFAVHFAVDELTRRAEELRPRQQDLYVAGEGGYHTYRIPAILRTQAGSLLAFCEGRKNSGADAGDIDLVVRRSIDGGETWSPMQIVHEEGKNTIGNPCPVVDRDTGVIWLLFCRNNDRVFVTGSEDDGQTWAEPREITADVKSEGWGWYATGPVHGIQMRSGRLVIPCDHSPGDGQQHSHIVYSDDHGATWERGGVLPADTDECTVVELADGRLCLNMRSYQGKNRRHIAFSKDGGETWSEVRPDEALVEPVCQGSILGYSWPDEGRSCILFSNPADVTRQNMTVRVSYDECETWPVAKTLHRGPSAYSDLVALGDGWIGCLYERGETHPYEGITFARFPLSWVTDGA